MDLRNIEQTTEPESDVHELIPREVTLNVKYTAPDGTKYHELLCSRIPDGDGRALIDRRSALLAGVPWSQLSEYAQARFLALATISVHFVRIPDWVNVWAQEDDDLLFSLREEVERHTLAWFRSGVGADSEGAPISRVRISQSHVRQAPRGGE